MRRSVQSVFVDGVFFFRGFFNGNDCNGRFSGREAELRTYYLEFVPSTASKHRGSCLKYYKAMVV